MHAEAMTFNNVLANLGIAKQTNECDKVIQINYQKWYRMCVE